MSEQCDQDEIDALLAEAEELTTEVSGQPPPPPDPPPSPTQTQGDYKARAEFRKKLPPELRRIMQLEVPVIVKLASRTMNMGEVLDLNVGSIIEFERPSDSELELMVSNRQVGLGQAVKVGENFGLRITRIGTIYETIKALGS